MIKFVVSNQGVILEYESDQVGNAWAWHELKKRNEVTISQAFKFNMNDLVSQPTKNDLPNDLESFIYQFRLASMQGNYFKIDGRILGIPDTVLIEGIPLSRKTFVAERNTSIFLRISRLIPPTQNIVIGGPQPNAVPTQVFEELLDQFPNSGELDRYASARVATVLGDYFNSMKDARGIYEAYLNRVRSKGAANRSLTFDKTALFQAELDKYILIRDTINTWLSGSDSRSEKEWQDMIINFLQLIFPKYVAVLTNVKILDSYSSPGAVKDRFIDIALVDAGGNIDIIEIKKPFDNALLSKAQYRDNYIPAKELSGSIMQAEKYLFHLSKWGIAGEAALTKKYGPELPKGLSIRITNPKGGGARPFACKRLPY